MNSGPLSKERAGTHSALLADMPDKQRRAYLHGDWDVQGEIRKVSQSLYCIPVETAAPAPSGKLSSGTSPTGIGRGPIFDHLIRGEYK